MQAVVNLDGSEVIADEISSVNFDPVTEGELEKSVPQCSPNEPENWPTYKRSTENEANTTCFNIKHAENEPC